MPGVHGAVKRGGVSGEDRRTGKAERYAHLHG